MFLSPASLLILVLLALAARKVARARVGVAPTHHGRTRSQAMSTGHTTPRRGFPCTSPHSRRRSHLLLGVVAAHAEPGSDTSAPAASQTETANPSPSTPQAETGQGRAEQNVGTEPSNADEKSSSGALLPVSAGTVGDDPAEPKSTAVTPDAKKKSTDAWEWLTRTETITCRRPNWRRSHRTRRGASRHGRRWRQEGLARRTAHLARIAEGQHGRRPGQHNGRTRGWTRRRSADLRAPVVCTSAEAPSGASARLQIDQKS